MPILGPPQSQGTAGGTDITSALKGITLQISALVKAIPGFKNLFVATSGGTMTGPLILSGDPTSSSPKQQAATKNYVDGLTGGGGGGGGGLANGFFVGMNIYSSSTTITIPSATQAHVQMWGATGGSGGSKSAASGNTAGSGGSGAGGYLEKLFTGLTAGNTMIYTQGDAGTAGAASTTATGNGGNATVTTLAVNGTTLTCNGSNGTEFANLEMGDNTIGGTATGGDINIQGQSGGTTYGGGEAQGSAIGGMTFFSKGADGVTATFGHTVAGNPGNPGGLKITWYS